MPPTRYSDTPYSAKWPGSTQRVRGR